MEQSNEQLTVDIDTEGGTVTCTVISVFDVEDKNYIALFPQNVNPENIYLFKYNEISEENVEILNIEDEDEYAKALEKFDSLMEKELD